MKLRNLLLLAFLPITLIFIAAIGFIVYNKYSNTLISYALKDVSESLHTKEREISLFSETNRGDVLFLSELSSLEKLINADDEDSIESAKLELKRDFLSFSDNRKIYYQVRYLDETGKEVVRVDSDKHKIEIVKEKNLQNKKGRYYFDDTVKLDKGLVFISPLDLNIENGEIEDRGFEDNPEYVPVIRYGTPVFDKKNNNKGIVLTNIYASEFLSYINEDKRLFLLVNDEGFYMSHPDKTKEWGFMFDNDQTIHLDYPSISQQILSDDSGQLFDDVTNKYFTFLNVDITNIHHEDLNDIHWILLSVDDKNFILESVIKDRNNVLPIALIMFAIILSVSIFVSKKITAPINQLTMLADEISKGKLDVKIDDKILKNKSEVGDLARAFERIFISLKLAMKKKDEES